MLNKLCIGAALAALLLIGCDLDGPTARTAEPPTLTVDSELGEAIAGIQPGETRLLRFEALDPATSDYVRTVFEQLGKAMPEEVVLAVDEDALESRSGGYSSCRAMSIGCGHSPDCTGSSHCIRASKTMLPIGPCTHSGYKYHGPVCHYLYGCTDPDCEYFRDYAKQYHVADGGE